MSRIFPRVLFCPEIPPLLEVDDRNSRIAGGAALDRSRADAWAESVPVWSDSEGRLCKSLPRISATLIGELRDAIADGDPLGAAFCALRPPEIRRKMGATYTPNPIVDSMIEWAARTRVPQRIGLRQIPYRRRQAFP
jgi:hypothetical protein